MRSGSPATSPASSTVRDKGIILGFSVLMPTAACTSGADCPNGYGCMAIGNPPTKVCIKAEAYCDAGNTAACVHPEDTHARSRDRLDRP